MNIQLSDHFTYRKLSAFVLPTIAMMVLTSVYTLVDALFISHYVGEIALAAVNFVFPVIMLLGGLGFMFGTGGTALVAKTLGQGDGARARRYFTQITLLAALMGCAMAGLGIALLPQVCRMLGGTDELLPDAVLYGRIMLGFLPCCILQCSFQALVVAAEKPKMAFWLSVAGGVTNIVLDFLFVVVFRWGLAGAAFATGLSQAVAGLIPVVYFSLPNKSLLRFVRTRLELRPMLQACCNGASELVTGVSAAFIGMLYNYRLLQFYGEDGVAAYGVVMYVAFLFSSIIFGYDMGSNPLFAYNHGAENHTELRNLFCKSLVLLSGGGIVLCVAAITLSYPLAYVFVGYNAALTELARYAFCVFSVYFLLHGYNIFASGLFTAMNNGFISAVIAFSRTFLFPAAAVMLLPQLFGACGVWWSAAASEVLALFVSIVLVLRNRKKYGYL
jgi:putative MATE family efflux protein